MFWKSNFGSSAQIDKLLEKEDVTLKEIMDEEEMLQECKVQNKKLIDFLTKQEVLDEMVTMVVTEPAPDSELKSRFKYANLAAEVLTCGDVTIFETLANTRSLLLTLYKFLENDPPLNPLLASFFSKVLGMLVTRRTEQNWCSYQFTCFRVMDFLKSKDNFVELSVRHIGTSAIMDFLAKLVCEVEDQEIKQNINKWLSDCRLIEQLIDKLGESGHPDEHSSIDQLICDIVINSRNTSNNSSDSQSSLCNGVNNNLLSVIESEEMINKLLDILLPEDCSDSSVCHVINILVTLINAKPVPTPQQVQQQLQQQQQMQQQRTDPSGSVDSSDSETNDSRINVAQVLVKRLPDIQSILLRPCKKRIPTAYGGEMEPLGTTRLKIVTLITALISTNDNTIHRSLADLNTLQHVLDIFFKFTLNNFVHTQVVQCLTTILTAVPPPPLSPDSGGGGEDEHNLDPVLEEKKHPLLVQLITKCHIIDNILEAHLLLPVFDDDDDSNSSSKHNLCGFMGHLRIIANMIVKQSEEGVNAARIKYFINSLYPDIVDSWIDFTTGRLVTINYRNEIPPLPGFKEMDMELGDVRYADNEFKDADDFLSGTLQRLSTQIGLNAAGLPSGVSNEPEVEDNDLFEEMCAMKRPDDNFFHELWDDKEKEISFAPNNSDTKSDNTDEAHSSSDEEDGEDDFATLRNSDEKMEVDQNDEWSAVFDKKDDASATAEDSFNPWQSAQAEDISSDNSWANFGSNVFSNTASTNPFVSNNTESNNSLFITSSVPDLATGASSNLVPIQSKTTEFKVDFDAAFGGSSASVSDCDILSGRDEVSSTSGGGGDKASAVVKDGAFPSIECQSEPEASCTTVQSSHSTNSPSTMCDSSQDNLEDNFMFLSSRGMIKQSADTSENAAMTTATRSDQDPGGD